MGDQLVFVYKSLKKNNMFLYLARKDAFADVPSGLLDAFGAPKFVLMFALSKKRTLVKVTHEELSRASLLKTPQEVLAVFEQPHYEFDANVTEQSLCLALDDVQDPGNLGTIIRIADWFGIEHIFCSSGTADVYNPKTIQATMGAIARVKLHYCNLPDFLRSAFQKNIPIFGTFLDGENIYTQELPANGIIIMGYEGNGISKQIAEMVTHRILIPNYPHGC